jgi:tRNA pseudouridine13 synthase
MEPKELSLPYASEEYPGIGGAVKESPEDFRVEEIPAYQPEGAGEHLFVRLEKWGVTTREVQMALARAYGIHHRDVGYAGIKDKQAVAVQYFSVWLKNQQDPQRAYSLQKELPVRILSTAPHRHKLKQGHLVGNLFDIRVASPALAPDAAAARAEEIAAVLRQRGVPNYYGAQRFGSHGDNALQGYELLQGSRRVKQKWLRRFLLSAYQSYLFNCYLTLRIGRGLYRRMLAGDIAKKHDTGGLFVVEEVAAEQQRLEAGEICYTGPIYGRKMKRAGGEAGGLEEQVLAENGIGWEELRAAKLTGSRRQGILLPEIRVSPAEEGLRLRFSLPKGAYATTVLREIMKSADLASPSSPPLDE